MKKQPHSHIVDMNFGFPENFVVNIVIYASDLMKVCMRARIRAKKHRPWYFDSPTKNKQNAPFCLCLCEAPDSKSCYKIYHIHYVVNFLWFPHVLAKPAKFRVRYVSDNDPLFLLLRTWVRLHLDRKKTWSFPILLLKCCRFCLVGVTFSSPLTLKPFCFKRTARNFNFQV